MSESTVGAGQRRRVQILRESLGKVARTLVGRGVKVTQIGVSAYVIYDNKGAPKQVNIPMIPDDAGEQLLNAIQGFLDHEIGHVMFTDWQYIKIANQAKCGALFNMLEDTYVERMMQMEFTGCSYNLNNMRKVFISKYIEPKLKELVEAGETDEMKYWMILQACSMRAWAGQQAFVDFMADKWHFIPNFQKAIEPLATKIENIIASHESCELAMDIKKILLGAKDDSDDSEGGSENEGSESKKSDGNGGSGSRDDTFQEDSDESDGGQEGEQQSETEESESDQPEGEGGDSEENEPGDGEESEGDNESEGNDESAEEESDQESLSIEADQEGKGEDAEESDELRSPESAGESETGDSDNEADGSAENESESNEPDEIGNDTQNYSLPQISESDIEASEDFDDLMSKLVKQMVEDHQATNEDYMPYTREWDVIEKAEISPGYMTEWFTEIDNQVKEMSSVMAKNLERAFRAANKSRWEAGKKSGRLNGPALSRLLANDPRVMRTREEMKTRDVAVTLLVDCSGSMSGGKIKTAITSAWALAEVMNKLSLPCEVLGFTTAELSKNDKAIHDRLTEDARNSSNFRTLYKRWDKIYMPIFKSFDERFGTEQKARLASMAFDTARMGANVDGESLEYAAARLRKRMEPGKVMIVLSDGRPAASGDMGALMSHLKGTVKSLNKEGINTVGIGINTTCVEDYYPKHVSLDNITDLPGTVMNELRQAILQKA